MKYFVYKLSHDKGQICAKTGASNETTAINNIMLFENCPQNAIEIKEIPLSLLSLNAKTLFNSKSI